MYVCLWVGVQFVSVCLCSRNLVNQAHAHIFTHTHTHTTTHARILIYAYTHIRTYTHTHIHTYTNRDKHLVEIDERLKRGAVVGRGEGGTW